MITTAHMTSNANYEQAKEPPAGLDPHEDARAIVRLFQCRLCSLPLRQPMTLPCGSSLCRQCMPPLFKRENISYPIDPRRTDGFTCPFDHCGLDHALNDCSLDVTLNKILDLVQACIDTLPTPTDISTSLEEQQAISEITEKAAGPSRSDELPGARVVATYKFAGAGKLDYSADVIYNSRDLQDTQVAVTEDVTVVDALRDVIRGELECQVCYALMHDPLTTSCGHTLCRKCIARILDHSSLCPVCRRRLLMPPGVQFVPSNKTISGIIAGLFPDLLAARMIAADQDDAIDEETSMPLFPCTLAFPLMPTFLHIFEPRYRLMIRRSMESGTRRFGILPYNATRAPQGSMGVTPFLQYGTVLIIQRIELFPDGRSLIETIGSHRIRVLDHHQVDGYIVGRTQRIDDVSLADEEAIEAQETSGPEPQPEDLAGQLNHMSTQQLLQYGLDFIATARSRSAPWLHERVLAAYGEPPTDPASFPYWFASILPISELEKYQLLPTTSVRERLKLTARWIQRVEAAQRMRQESLGRRTVLDSSSDEDEDSAHEEEDAEVEAQAEPEERSSNQTEPEPEFESGTRPTNAE